MNEERQEGQEGREGQEGQEGYTTLVGMDAHSVTASLCVTRWRKGEEPVTVREFATDVASLAATYKKRIPAGSLTVLEASTNAFDIARRLRAAGHEAKVLSADTVSGMSRADRVNDRLDARNLAKAYANGGTREVRVPDERHARLRDVWFGYRDAVKDAVKWSNRLWGFCSMHGLGLPPRGAARKVEAIREAVKGKGWEGDDAFRAEAMLAEYAHALGMRGLYARKIDEAVAGDVRMARVMQVLGVRRVTAFALVTFIEDVTRFATSKKLVAYIGLNPTVRETGKSKEGRRVSRHGRRDLKALMIEAAQCALNKGEAPMHEWARRKVAQKKERNKVVCALARKMACHVWHILMGHPAPGLEPEASFRRKLTMLAGSVGREGLRRLGHGSAKEYADSVCASLRPQRTDAEPARPPASD